MTSSAMTDIVCVALVVFSLAGATQDNLDQWLKESSPTSAPTDSTVASDSLTTHSATPDFALPGAVEMSDGSVFTGKISTAGGGPLYVWVAAERRWRIVPPAAVLGMYAKIIREELFQQWRWKGMGEPEKVYTGKAYPLRQLEWTLILADGSRITGEIKGQPLYVYPAAGGDFRTIILSGRQKGLMGQSLKDLIYPKTVIFSRNAITPAKRNF